MTYKIVNPAYLLVEDKVSTDKLRIKIPNHAQALALYTYLVPYLEEKLHI